MESLSNNVADLKAYNIIENASFGIREDSMWLQLIYFLTTIAFWPVKYLFRICRTYCFNSHYEKFTELHKLISIVLQLTNQIK